MVAKHIDKGTSGLAITALIMGILSITIGWIPFFGWLFIGLAILFGILGLNQTKNGYSGKGLAIAGLILACIPLIFQIFVIIFFVFLGAVGSATLDSIEHERQAAVNDVAPEVVRTETTPTQPQNLVYSMNEDIKVDYLTYRITNVESFQRMGSSFLTKETEGQFIKVTMRITNDAMETKQMFTPRFRIKDSLGREYDRLSDDIMYISDALEFGRQLQPGLSTTGAIVFELPLSSEDLSLEISGDWLSRTRISVSLDNIYYKEADTTQKEEIESIWDDAMTQSQQQWEDLMNQCNAPFRCTASCGEYMDVGQLDCPSGQVCCMG
ncbi:MAG: DUF4190 domain-containing protein [Candidatus Woesearchaeota archaeon]